MGYAGLVSECKSDSREFTRVYERSKRGSGDRLTLVGGRVEGGLNGAKPADDELRKKGLGG